MKKIIKVAIFIFFISLLITCVALYIVFDVSIELSDLYTEAIAAFFGFGAALVGSEITERIAENHEKKQLLDELQKELRILQKELPKINPSALKITPLKAPCLKNTIKSQKIALLSSNGYTDIQRQLLQLDEIIDDYNEWNKLVATGVVVSGRNYSSAVSSELDKLKSNISEKIDETIKLFKN